MADTSIEETVKGLCASTKLPPNEVKKAIYWRMASIRIADFAKFPGLAFVGPAGSGKSTMMNALRDMDPANSQTLSCIRLSTAEARDQLSDAHNQTVFCEEFDQLSDPASAYILFHSRTERSLSTIAVKQQHRTNGPFEREEIDVFGATVVHSRNDLDDPALSSRFMTIHTRHQKGPFPRFVLDADVKGIAKSLVLPDVAALNGRMEETWLPIIQVAHALGDEAWVAWAQEQIALLQEALLEAAEYDRKSVILGKVIELISRRAENPTVHGPDPWYRINISAEISEPLRTHGYPDITAFQVNAAIGSLGLKTVRSGGRRWLFPTPLRLILACERASYVDEWVEKLKETLDRG